MLKHIFVSDSFDVLWNAFNTLLDNKIFICDDSDKFYTFGLDTCSIWEIIGGRDSFFSYEIHMKLTLDSVYLNHLAMIQLQALMSSRLFVSKLTLLGCF